MEGLPGVWSLQVEVRDFTEPTQALRLLDLLEKDQRWFAPHTVVIPNLQDRQNQVVLGLRTHLREKAS